MNEKKTEVKKVDVMKPKGATAPAGLVTRAINNPVGTK